VTLPDSKNSQPQAVCAFEQLARLRKVDWFSNAGRSQCDNASRLAVRYLNLLSLGDCRIRYAENADDVTDCLSRKFDPEWAAAEEQSYQRLIREIGTVDAISAQAVEFKRFLTEIALATNSAAMCHIGGKDPYLAKVAAGCAMETGYRFLLESATKTDSNACFTVKLEIFELGRWPLCLSSGSFVIY